MRTFLGGRFSSVRKRFFDNFTRANQTGLGIATDGSSWTAVNGTLSINSNKATAASAGSNASSGFQMATITMPVNNAKIELKDTTNGSAAALWVQNATDWWMVSQSAQGYSYSYYYYVGTTTSYGYSTSYGYTTTYGYTRLDALIWVQYSTSTQWSSSSSWSSTVDTYGYASGTGTNYYLKLVQSVAGVVSTVANWFIASDTLIRSFRVTTSGSTISATAFSDTSLTNQLGSTQTSTPSSPTTTPQYGISLNTSPASQGYSIAASVNITENL